MSKKVHLPFLKVQPISELPEITTLEPGGSMLVQQADGTTKRIRTEAFYQILSNIAKPVFPNETGPFSINQWYKPMLNSDEPGIGYSNLTPAVDENNQSTTLKAISGYDTLFIFDGAHWRKYQNKLLGASVSVEFDPTTEIDAQGGKQIWDAAEEIVTHAFSMSGSSYPDQTYGWGIDGETLSPPPNISNKVVSNAAFSLHDGVIKKLRVRFSGSSTVNFVICSISGSSIIVHSTHAVALTNGINNIDVNISILEGQTLGYLFNTGANVYYKDGGTHQYFTNALGNGGITYITGCLSYEFTVDHSPSGTSYSVNQIKSILDNINNQEKAISLSIHSRITIEGQSNALGVAFSSGLSNPPYNDALLNWLNDLSRVFIWNPQSDDYENIRIGVNNMASWDSDYLYPGTSPTALSFGPEIGIALVWLQTHPIGNLYIDKNVGDGRPIAYFQKGQPYYSEKINRKNKADQWLKDRNIAVNEAGFIWIQGENDKNQSKEYYKTQLEQLIQDRKIDGFIKNYTNLILTQIPNSSIGFGSGVYEAKQEYVVSNKMAVVVNYPSAFNSDNIHLNTAGQINLGIKCATKCLITDALTYSDLQIKSYWNK